MALDSPSEIATFLGIDASDLSRLMRKLETKHLIERLTDQKNRSRVIIKLTAHGKKLAQKIRPHVRQMETTVMSVLTDSEQKTLLKILKTMCVSVFES